MLQTFGRTFICDDQATARQVMEKFKFVCVTIEGDKYEPGGTLHGGSQSQRNILRMVQEFKVFEEERV